MSAPISSANAQGLPQAQQSIDLAHRLKFFDVGDHLRLDCAIVSEALAGREHEIAAAFWDHFNSACDPDQCIRGDMLESAIKVQTEYVRLKYGAPTDQKWIDSLSHQARIAFTRGNSVALVLSACEASHQVSLTMMREAYHEETAKLRAAAICIFKLAMIECETFAANYAAIIAAEGNKERSDRADVFRENIAEEVSGASALGTKLREQAGNASVATRGMLGKASEVAAAAEQSATAMRDAAHTAAGLIRAIEDARTEVDLAADVATRAATQAGDAVKVSQALSDTAKSIESILGLIRDVAGQTNLLALNATIEAARAGDAGRGFAVVAQEVKSLANQTARATDDIAAKIAAIQAATKSTVDTNGSIRDTVAEVQASANRIREAMEIQAQTVTMITAAVDETALAADTMSTTIAAIRADTEDVATEIDNLETGFESVNAKLALLQDAAGNYVKLVA